MGIQEDAQNNAQQNKGMNVDPKWTSAEKEKYIASFNATKKKEDEKDRQEDSQKN